MMTSFSPPGLPSEFSLRMAFFFELCAIALVAPTAAVRPKAERMDPKRSANVRRDVGKFMEVLLFVLRFEEYLCGFARNVRNPGPPLPVHFPRQPSSRAGPPLCGCHLSECGHSVGS